MTTELLDRSEDAADVFFGVQIIFITVGFSLLFDLSLNYSRKFSLLPCLLLCESL